MLAGQKFYSGINRTVKTGLFIPPVATDFTNQVFSFRDDYAGPNGAGGSEDYQGEEATWTNTNAAAEPDKVWKDDRTGLYWSSSISTVMSNGFTMSTCPYFSITPPTSIVGGRSNWYLPNQKELMMAYIDGMYNKAGTTLANAAAFTTTNFYWSSSEVSFDSTTAWLVFLGTGRTFNANKSDSYSVRCVSRD